MKNSIRLWVLSLLFLSGLAQAHSYTVGDIEIDHPFIRETPPGAAVAGGFMAITNHGEEADRLIGGTVEFARALEVHTMEMQGDVMKMMKLPNGLEIPAGSRVELKPGSFHIMFIQLNDQLQAGDQLEALLEFEKAGEVSVHFNVEAMKHDGHHDHRGH